MARAKTKKAPKASHSDARSAKNTDLKGAIRRRILEAALACYGSKGVSETTYADIAAEAGISPPLLKYHYPSSRSLFLEIFQMIVEQLRHYAVTALQKAKSKKETELEAYCGAILDWAAQNRNEYSVWLYIYHMAAHNENFAQLNRNVRDVGRDRISLLLYQAIEKKEIAPPVGSSIPDLALTIQNLLTGVAIVFGTEPNLSLESSRRLLLASVNRLCGARN